MFDIVIYKLNEKYLLSSIILIIINITVKIMLKHLILTFNLIIYLKMMYS